VSRHAAHGDDRRGDTFRFVLVLLVAGPPGSSYQRLSVAEEFR
jgi:hypothetical protein